jgi:hypothetical protein
VASEHWRELLERLAESARSVDDLGGEPLNEIIGQETPNGVALLAAVEDSLALMLSNDPDTRERRALPDEILGLLRAAREEGVWRYLTAD